jgi:hypothetical protein
MYAFFYIILNPVTGGRTEKKEKKCAVLFVDFFWFSQTRTIITNLNAFFGKCEEHPQSTLFATSFNYFYSLVSAAEGIHLNYIEEWRSRVE